jgi:ribosomal protein S18 acetylase RimI-like enzyme
MQLSCEDLSLLNAESALVVLAQLRIDLQLDRLLEFVGHSEYRFLVFRRGAVVVAVCGYRMLETITRGVHCHLHDLAVDCEVRGQGIGREVILHLMRIARSDGRGWIFVDGVDDALRFYNKLGFERHAATLLKLAIPAQQ